MKHPVIGITTYGLDARGRYNLPHQYVDAVRAAGGVPVLLPPGESHVEGLLEVIDGLILAGGGDIDPALYNGRPHPTIERVDSRRDALELELSRQALARPLPVLGICRGQQVLAVATGGTLVEHIPDEYGQAVIHRDGSGEYVQHPVEVETGSRLAEILGATELPTPSRHHQAVREVPPEWRVVARAADGVIEALEHRHHPWMIAVQWHPEQAYRDPRHGRLFTALVEAARRRK